MVWWRFQHLCFHIVSFYFCFFWIKQCFFFFGRHKVFEFIVCDGLNLCYRYFIKYACCFFFALILVFRDFVGLRNLNHILKCRNHYLISYQNLLNYLTHSCSFCNLKWSFIKFFRHLVHDYHLQLFSVLKVELLIYLLENFLTFMYFQFVELNLQVLLLYLMKVCCCCISFLFPKACIFFMQICLKNWHH